MLVLIRIATTAMFVSLLLAVGGAASDTSIAHATTGVGGTISLGPAAGASVPANTSAASDAYAGFNLHARAVASGGITLTGMSGSAAGSTILSAGDPGSVACYGSVPMSGDLVFGCVALNGQSTSTAGLLATLTVAASGNGCVAVRLITTAVGDPDIALLNTYTINAPISTETQANAVNGIVVHVLFGSGTVADCASLASVGGFAEGPNLPESTVPARGSSTIRHAFVFAFAAAVVGGGVAWYSRRNRG